MRLFSKLILLAGVMLLLVPMYGYWHGGAWWKKLYQNQNLAVQDFPSGSTTFLKQVEARFSSITNQAAVLGKTIKENLAPASSGFLRVTRIIDGDTIELENGKKIRYIGVNSPETVAPKRPVQCYGKQASAYNKNLVLGKKVRLQKDVSETDKYGRLLRYVYLQDGTFVNLKLVQDGYAYVETVPPDIEYAARFVVAARKAQDQLLGLWSTCRGYQE